MQKKLNSLLKAHELVCGAVIHESGTILARAGDFDRLNNPEFVQLYLEHPQVAFEGLRCQILPAFTARGAHFSLRDKPTSSLMVLAFGLGVRSAMQQFRLAREFHEAVVGMPWDTGKKPQETSA